uniref:Uncharacterized protein n=1 Tax=Ascaris lumbricoides TaxID=6252 RepID=A0A9J2P0F6_ASCLU
MRNMLQIAACATTTTKSDNEGTCCNCCHIKHGTFALGLLELIGVILLLSGVVKKIILKNTLNECKTSQSYFSRLFEDCLLRNFSHFDWTLAGDYVLALLLALIFLCILLLFIGIIKKSTTMVLPHLVVQGICLLFSLAYFFLYAWSYVYGDLYVQNNEFRLSLAAVNAGTNVASYSSSHIGSFPVLPFLRRHKMLLILTVLERPNQRYTEYDGCLWIRTLHGDLLQQLLSLKSARLRRLRQFEECSERVRNAKQNGLWRSTSWGGGFQEYKGQYDEGNHWKKKRDKPIAHVQWNLPGNSEKLISIAEEPLQEGVNVTERNSPYRSTANVSNSTQSQLTMPNIAKPAMRKDGILSVGIDTQLVEHSMHSPPLHLKTSDSALSQKSKAESNITQSSDLPSATRKRSSQDAKGRNKRDNDPGEQAHGTYSTPPEATSENRPERPHCRHHHHHHHCVQQTANSTGKRPKQIFWHMSQLLRDSAAPLASRFG